MPSLVGSIRPGLYFSAAPLRVANTLLAVFAVAPGRSTNWTPVSVRKRKPTRMLPGTSPPSVPAFGLIWRNS